MKLETLALHHGYTAEATTKAAAVPIYQTTSYTFDNTQHGADLFNLAVPGNIYTRIMNPTTDVLEKRVAEMEGGIAGLCLASGMSAITYAIQTIAGVGDNIVSTSQLYGGTYNLFMHSFPRQGIEVRMAAADDFEAFDRLIDANTKAVFCESIGNPAGNVVDIQRHIGENAEHQRFLDQGAVENHAMPCMMHRLGQPCPHQPGRCDRAVQTGQRHHIDNRLDALTRITHELTESVDELHFGRCIRAITQLVFQALELKAVRAAVR